MGINARFDLGIGRDYNGAEGVLQLAKDESI